MEGSRLAEHEWAPLTAAHERRVATQCVPPPEVRDRLACLPKRALVLRDGLYAYHDVPRPLERLPILMAPAPIDGESRRGYAERVLAKTMAGPTPLGVVLISDKPDWQRRGEDVASYLVEAAITLYENVPEIPRLLLLRQYRPGRMPKSHREALAIAAREFDLVLPSLPGNFSPDATFAEALFHASRYLDLPTWRILPVLAGRTRLHPECVCLFEEELRRRGTDRVWLSLQVMVEEEPVRPLAKSPRKRGPKGPNSKEARLRRVRRRLMLKGRLDEVETAPAPETSRR